MIRYPLTYNPILEYNAAIENGQVVVSKKVATVYRKLAQDVVNGCGDYAYKAKRANHAIEFIENYCRHSKGKAGGKPFILELWQKRLSPPCSDSSMSLTERESIGKSCLSSPEKTESQHCLRPSACI